MKNGKNKTMTKQNNPHIGHSLSAIAGTRCDAIGQFALLNNRLPNSISIENVDTVKIDKAIMEKFKLKDHQIISGKKEKDGAVICKFIYMIKRDLYVIAETDKDDCDCNGAIILFSRCICKKEAAITWGFSRRRNFCFRGSEKVFLTLPFKAYKNPEMQK